MVSLNIRMELLIYGAQNPRRAHISLTSLPKPEITRGRVETESDGTRKRKGGEVKGKKANGGGSQQSCTVSDTVYPALLPLMRTPRLPAAD